MKHLYTLLALCTLLIGFSACKSRKSTSSHLTVEAPLVQEQPKSLPSFPGEAIYIVSREFETIQNGESQNMDSPLSKLVVEHKLTLANYIELRLMELYPEQSYPGMIADIKHITQELENRYRIEYIETDKELPLALGKADSQLRPFTSLSDEAKWLEMTPKEEDKFKALNRLATQKQFASTQEIDQLIHFDHLTNGEVKIPLFLQENLLINTLFSGGSQLFYRIFQSKERAILKAETYYKGRTNSGMIGDAYRHITVNMLLTRFLSEDVAYWVMDVYWETQGKNAPCDKYMDFHNNYVGRHTQYSRFTKSANEVKTDTWESWCENIHQFVENPDNSIQPNWTVETLESIIKVQRKQMDSRKFIYWNLEKEE